MAFVDQLFKKNNGVEYLIVCQNLFVRTVNAKGKKTKDSKEKFRAFLTMITKKDQPKKIAVDKGTKCAGECKKYAKLKDSKFTGQ